MNIQELFNYFDKAKWTNSSGTSFKAICPAHDDRSPSLSVRNHPTKADYLQVKCWSGCETSDVLGAVGLQLKDLYLESNFTPEAQARHKVHKTKQSELSFLNELSHVMFVLNWYLNLRIESIYRSSDRAYMDQHPEHKPMPSQLWEREEKSAHNLKPLLEAYIHEHN